MLSITPDVAGGTASSGVAPTARGEAFFDDIRFLFGRFHLWISDV
jgi:hypothetical protein